MADRSRPRGRGRRWLWLVVGVAGLDGYGVVAEATAWQEDAATVSLAFPQNNEVLRPGGIVTIRGFAGAPYAVEYGVGYAPMVWSSHGITPTGGADGVLALWDTSSITRNDFYTLRLTSSAGPSRQRAYAHLVYFDTRLKTGWPQYVKMHSEYTLIDNQLQPLVADLDGDGRQSLYVWELEATYTTDSVAWPMFQRDPQHTARFVQ